MSMKWAGLLTATSVLVVIVTLGMDSLWLDEAFTINVSTTNSASELWTGAADPRHPPVYYVIERWSMGVVGTSEMAARLMRRPNHTRWLKLAMIGAAPYRGWPTSIRT